MLEILTDQLQRKYSQFEIQIENKANDYSIFAWNKKKRNLTWIRIPVNQISCQELGNYISGILSDLN